MYYVRCIKNRIIKGIYKPVSTSIWHNLFDIDVGKNRSNGSHYENEELCKSDVSVNH